MWVVGGSAIPLGTGSEPATHTCPSPLDGANSVGMSECVCRGILLKPPTGAATIFPDRWVPKAKCLVIRSKPQRAATRKFMIPTVLSRTGSPRRVVSLDERQIYLGDGCEARQQSVAATTLRSPFRVEGVTVIKYLGLPACLPQVWEFCLGTCLSHYARCIAIPGPVRSCSLTVK